MRSTCGTRVETQSISGIFICCASDLAAFRSWFHAELADVCKALTTARGIRTAASRSIMPSSSSQLRSHRTCPSISVSSQLTPYTLRGFKTCPWYLGTNMGRRMDKFRNKRKNYVHLLCMHNQNRYTQGNAERFVVFGDRVRFRIA